MAIAYSAAESIKHIQSMSEDQFTREIVVPLLSAMGFDGIRIEHGTAERGKDLLFWRHDPFGGREWCACQVKGHRLTGSAAGPDSLRTVVNQLQQAADTPFCDTDGNQVRVSRCLLITSSVLSPATRESVMGLLASHRVAMPTRVVDAPELVALIKQHRPSLLMPWQENLSEYCRRMEETFRWHLDYKALGLQEQPALEGFYIDVHLLIQNDVMYVRPWADSTDYTAAIGPDQGHPLLLCRDKLRNDCGIQISVSARQETQTRMQQANPCMTRPWRPSRSFPHPRRSSW